MFKSDKNNFDFYQRIFLFNDLMGKENWLKIEI